MLCCEGDLRKGIQVLAKLMFSFSVIFFLFSFHFSIQHDEASGYTFYDEVDCPN